MNFAMDDDVLELVGSIEDFFGRRGDAQAIAEATARSAATDRARWSALCEMGLPMLRVPGPAGIGAGLLEATAVAEKIGATLIPEPAIGTIVLADALSGNAAAAELLEELCSCARVVAFCGFDNAELSREGSISGCSHIPDDGITDAIALLARDHYTAEWAVVLADVAALRKTTRPSTLDPTRPTVLTELSGVEPTNVLRVTNETANRIRRELALLTIAELVGGMQRVLDDTVDYVNNREQFSRPIGSFQAVKHRLADMYARTEQARAAVQFASIACGDDAVDAIAAVCAVTRWVPRSAIDVCEEAIHLHGAMGYSWEVRPHLHLRRALHVRAALSAWVLETQATARIQEAG